MYKYKIKIKNRFKIYLQNLNFENFDISKNDEIITNKKSIIEADSILKSK